MKNLSVFVSVSFLPKLPTVLPLLTLRRLSCLVLASSSPSPEISLPLFPNHQGFEISFEELGLFFTLPPFFGGTSTVADDEVSCGGGGGLL